MQPPPNYTPVLGGAAASSQAVPVRVLPADFSLPRAPLSPPPCPPIASEKVWPGGARLDKMLPRMMDDVSRKHFREKADAAAVAAEMKAAENTARDRSRPRRLPAMPLDTPAVTPDPLTPSTEDERSPTSAPVTLAPGTPTHPPTEAME
eukprot:7175024-Heterocapsa_arctica.AAC.1